MNGIVSSGVCLLFLFTLSTADLCTDFADPTSDLFQCNAELVQRSNSACEDDCRSTLEQYADDCLMGAAAQTYKNIIETLCTTSVPTTVSTNPTSNPTCTDFTDTTSSLFQCNAELAQRSNSACEDDCRTSLEQYADDCLMGAAAQAFRDAIQTLCTTTTNPTTTPSNPTTPPSNPTTLPSNPTTTLSNPTTTPSLSNPTTTPSPSNPTTPPSNPTTPPSNPTTPPSNPTTLPSNPTCTAIDDSSSQLFSCNTGLVERLLTACGSDCRSTFEDFVNECLQGPAADSYRNIITTLCGEGTPSPTTNDTPSPTTNDTPAATTNNTSTDSAGAMGPALFSTASALFFAVYAAFL